MMSTQPKKETAETSVISSLQMPISIPHPRSSHTLADNTAVADTPGSSGRHAETPSAAAAIEQAEPVAADEEPEPSQDAADAVPASVVDADEEPAPSQDATDAVFASIVAADEEPEPLQDAADAVPVAADEAEEPVAVEAEPVAVETTTPVTSEQEGVQCSGSVPLDASTDSTGFISDGSSKASSYKPDLLCEWTITAPEGYVSDKPQ
jgi:hypothetical protein